MTTEFDREVVLNEIKTGQSVIKQAMCGEISNAIAVDMLDGVLMRIRLLVGGYPMDLQQFVAEFYGEGGE